MGKLQCMNFLCQQLMIIHSFIHSFLPIYFGGMEEGTLHYLGAVLSVWAVSALSLVNLQRERIRAEESWRRSHGCGDLAVEVPGWKCTALRWKCCSRKAKCQGEGSVLTQSVALELHNKERLWGKTLKYWGRNQKASAVLPSYQGTQTKMKHSILLEKHPSAEGKC